MNSKTALKNLLCHHRIVKAMNGQESSILVTDTLLDRLNDCKVAVADNGDEMNRADLLAAMLDAFRWLERLSEEGCIEGGSTAMLHYREVLNRFGIAKAGINKNGGVR